MSADPGEPRRALVFKLADPDAIDQAPAVVDISEAAVPMFQSLGWHVLARDSDLLPEGSE
jgi:hypothetical protein